MENSCIGKAQYYKGGITVGRNSILQKMFLLMGVVEQAGSGVNKIFTGWDEANRTFPYVEETDRPDRTILHLPKLCLLDSMIVEGLESLFGNQIKQLNKNALWALAICYTEQEISNASLQYRINLHRSDITQLLKELCSKELLCSQGNGRGTTYYPNGTSSNYLNISKRMKKDELEWAIIHICSSEYLTIQDIAERTGKSTIHLKHNVLPAMLEKNLLERKFENPKHPAQKYKAKLSNPRI